jgi:hypothetical protein
MLAEVPLTKKKLVDKGNTTFDITDAELSKTREDLRTLRHLNTLGAGALAELLGFVALANPNLTSDERRIVGVAATTLLPEADFVEHLRASREPLLDL